MNFTAKLYVSVNEKMKLSNFVRIVIFYLKLEIVSTVILKLLFTLEKKEIINDIAKYNP